MPRRLKYRIIDGRGRTVHHSFNKRNAEKWIHEYGKSKNLGITRIRSKEELRAIHAKKKGRRW